MWAEAVFQLAKSLPSSLENKPIRIQGKISSIPEWTEGNVRFEFDITEPVEGWEKSGALRLFWANPDQKPEIGDEWRLSAKLKRPRGLSNPGSFDKEKHFFSHRWVGEGVVVIKEKAERLSSLDAHSIHRWRILVLEYLNTRLINRKYSGLIAALVVGVTAGINQDQWAVFRDTGTAHLMAISGLHVGFIGAFFYGLGNMGWRFLGCPFKLPAQWVAAWGGWMGAFGYAWLAGFSVPTQRALVMLILYFSCILLRLQTAVWRNYCFALGVVLLIDPFASLMPGFWLSFGSVGIILYGMKGRLNPKDRWWKWGRAQWVAFLGLIPLSIGFFQQFSWISPMTNLIAIPWVTFLVVPLALISVLILPINEALAGWVLDFSEKALSLLFPILEFASKLPQVIWVSEAVSPFIISCALIGFLIFIAPRGFPGRWMGLFWCLPLFLVKTPHVSLGELRFTLLDVGQGLSAVLETKHHLLVFDAGPKKGSWDAGERVIYPFLRLNGHQKVDSLIISHGDLDHIGGMESILKKIPVERIITSEPEKIHFNQVETCFAGKHWEWDGVKFEMLHPARLETRKRNDHSCVLRVSTGKQALLLTGDIEGKSELEMIEGNKALSATVLVVPHHGSRTSSTEAFIKAVRPSFALLPVGYLNPYGHPKSEIIQRYQRQGITLLDSIRDGAITFLLKEAELENPILHRKQHRSFWSAEFKAYD